MDKKNIFLSILFLIIGIIIGVFLADAERAVAPSTGTQTGLEVTSK